MGIQRKTGKCALWGLVSLSAVLVSTQPVRADLISFGVPTTNPGWNNLVDSTGAVTSASLSITGTVGGVDFDAFFPGLDPLRSDAVVWNDFLGGSSSISTTIDWTLSGLTPNATYDMCVYGSEADYDRSFNMTIEGTTLNVPTYNYATPTTTPRRRAVCSFQISSRTEAA
jgi:hypothetical protein